MNKCLNYITSTKMGIYVDLKWGKSNLKICVGKWSGFKHTKYSIDSSIFCINKPIKNFHRSMVPTFML